MADPPTIDDLLVSDTGAGNAPAMPDINPSDVDHASLDYSRHRTKLSTHRTALSIRRTSLSERRTDLSGRRTGMSFQRTRMSAERTLMSVIRTSLSLISFGFTIYQFLGNLVDKKLVAGSPHAARNFGMALIYLGVAMIVAGIAYHLQFMWGLRRERAHMHAEGDVHAQSGFPASFTLLVAILLLLLGLVAIASLSFHIGPFG